MPSLMFIIVLVLVLVLVTFTSRVGKSFALRREKSQTTNITCVFKSDKILKNFNPFTFRVHQEHAM